MPLPIPVPILVPVPLKLLIFIMFILCRSMKEATIERMDFIIVKYSSSLFYVLRLLDAVFNISLVLKSEQKLVYAQTVPANKSRFSKQTKATIYLLVNVCLNISLHARVLMLAEKIVAR